MFIAPPYLCTYYQGVCSFSSIHMCITPKLYSLIMFNNKVFNVSLITAFNDLHMFINFIFKKFDRFHDKFTPYNLPSNHQWNLVQLTSNMLSIYCPSLLWNNILKMFWNNITLQTPTASHSLMNHVIFQIHV